MTITELYRMMRCWRAEGVVLYWRVRVVLASRWFHPTLRFGLADMLFGFRQTWWAYQVGVEYADTHHEERPH